MELKAMIIGLSLIFLNGLGLTFTFAEGLFKILGYLIYIPTFLMIYITIRSFVKQWNLK